MPGHTKGGECCRCKRETINLLGWPTDCFAIDHHGSQNRKNEEWIATSRRSVHTVLVFVPGNPGLIDWYVGMFTRLVELLGPGYCARGAANAGHSLDPRRVNTVGKPKWVSWTVRGQSLHKADYVDHLRRYDVGSHVDFVFVGHSIGVYFVNHMLLHRPDVLEYTRLVISLMPFTRMLPAKLMDKILLEWAAAHPQAMIRIGKFVLSNLPVSVSKKLLSNSIPDPAALEISCRLIQNVGFVENFFSLGTEELRDVPECVDTTALQYISRKCRNVMFFASSGDKWAPPSHIRELRELLSKGVLPSSIVVEDRENMFHDFVCHPGQVDIVVKFCYDHLRRLHGNSRL